jgi:hypothetical protein
MSLEALTDAQIAALLGCQKRVVNPAARERTEGKHLRRDFRVLSTDGRHEFVLFTRQSTVLANGFSAGLRWLSKAGEEVMLLRCNGSDHPHSNVLEAVRLPSVCHVHTATEKYIVAGKRSEGFAQPTTAYSTLAGALHEVTRIANIAGINTKPDEHDLFAQP